MITYNLKLAYLSICRNPFLTLMIVGAIGLGTGVFMILLTAYHLLERDPIPQKSAHLYRVMLDSWEMDSTYAGGLFGEVPTHLTYMDATAIAKSTIPTYHSLMMKSRMYLKSSATEAISERPVAVSVRLSNADFFPMFDTPFLYGGPWSSSADEVIEPVVVISKKMNDHIFGGTDSIGQNLLLDGNLFRVVGVMDEWRPVPLFYNIVSLDMGVGETEDVYIPFGFYKQYQLANNGMSNNWKSSEPGFENYLASEAVWIQYWAQLDSEEQKQQYMDYLNNYANEQKKVGRFKRPLNNQLLDVPTWIKTITRPINGPSLAFLVLGVLYLFVCMINLIGVLMGKFIGRMHEVSIRRALGAPRSAIFSQFLYEVIILGVIGGLLGLAISQTALFLISARFELADDLFALDAYLLLSALSIAAIAGISAGVLPAWRACSVAPTTYLKSE